MRLIQISDTHLSHRGGPTNANFARLAELINGLRPDLVVHTGDVVALVPDSEEDRSTARRLLDMLDAQVLVLPGNHDVGDVGDDPWMGIRVNSRRIQAFRQSFGPDRWLDLRYDGIALLGVNSQLLSSGLGEEGEQWEWIAAAARAAADRSVLLFLHKPLWPPPAPSGPGAAQPPWSLSVSIEDRSRILGLFRPRQVRVVASGHLHRQRRTARGVLLEVWAPAAGFVSRSPYLPLEGAGLGVLEYRCWNGAVEITARTVDGLQELEPQEIAQLVADLEGIPGAT